MNLKNVNRLEIIIILGFVLVILSVIGSAYYIVGWMPSDPTYELERINDKIEVTNKNLESIKFYIKRN